MKKILEYINEALKDTDKGIKDMLDFFAKQLPGVQGALHAQKAQDAESVDIVPLSEVFTDDEIERLLDAADSFPDTEQNPARKYQIPVMFRILFNCGLRTSELLKLRICDVDLDECVFTVLDTKFHKSRLVPFSEVVSESLKQYLEI